MIADPAVRTADLGHAQVHIRREPAVELDLAGARRCTGLKGAEVEEAKADRLLHLAGAVTGEEHHGRMVLAT